MLINHLHLAGLSHAGLANRLRRKRRVSFDSVVHSIGDSDPVNSASSFDGWRRSPGRPYDDSERGGRSDVLEKVAAAVADNLVDQSGGAATDKNLPEGLCRGFHCGPRTKSVRCTVAQAGAVGVPPSRRRTAMYTSWDASFIAG